MRASFIALLALAGATACSRGEPSRSVDVLAAVFDQFGTRITDIDPVRVHPSRLRAYEQDNPMPGFEGAHYEAGPWKELATAADRTGLTLCAVGAEGLCSIGVDERAGFVAVGQVQFLTVDSAAVWLVVTEQNQRVGYAAEFFKVELGSDSGRWRVLAWRPMGAAN